ATVRRPWRTVAPGLLPLRQSGFNAATVRRPWRTASTRRGWTPGRPCFNAATVRRPWRTLDLTADGKWLILLQCGHGPKTVENAADGGTWEGLPRLQCGHGPKTVENYVVPEIISQLAEASMRPRSEDRGEPRDPVRCNVAQKASMRPRS